MYYANNRGGDELKNIFTIRLEPETIERIKKVATEGNVGQWIRLLIQKELERIEKEDKK